MAQWGSTDASSNSVLWAATSVKVTPNTANRDSLFGNTTADATITGATVGQFGVAADEVAASLGGISHTGWVLRTTGSGGRAGRVFSEVLVAGGISSDADAATVPNYAIRITSQPANATANATASETAVFTVVASSRPTGATLAYRWEANTGSGFVNAASGTTGNTTASLSVASASATNGAQYRVVISTTNANTVTSAAAVLTITT